MTLTDHDMQVLDVITKTGAAKRARYIACGVYPDIRTEAIEQTCASLRKAASQALRDDGQFAVM